VATDLQIASQRIVSLNPATGEVLREIECAGESEVRDAVARARAAQPGWAELGLRRRIEILRKFQAGLYARKSEVAAVITREAGKPLAEALVTEVLVVLDAARFLIDNAWSLLRDEPVPHANIVAKLKSGWLVREPHGVIGIISPWNYPFSIPATETLAALVTGNAVVLKPSELTPISALELARLLYEAGVPEEILTVVLGEGLAGAALIESKIDKLFFTGSVATGKRVAEAAARRLLPVVLELGGKDAMLVLDDADVDVASSAAVWGAMMNAGQTCLSVERCYVHRSLYDQFVASCAKKIQQLKVGIGTDSGTDVGPLISERQLRIVETQVDDARALGANVVVGGHRLPELGSQFYAPTLITNVSRGMKLMHEETFGPLLPVIPFTNDAEAVKLVNDSEFGLAASVFTRDRKRGEGIAKQLNAGAVMINDLLSCFAMPEAPHGGTGASGIGRTHGLMGMREMVCPKYIDSDMLAIKKVWWYPYGEAFTRQMSAFVEMLFARSAARKMSGSLKSAASLWRKKL